MAAPVDAKLLKKTKFPPEFSRKVDMKKVNIEVMKKYVFPGFPQTLTISELTLATGGLPVESPK